MDGGTPESDDALWQWWQDAAVRTRAIARESALFRRDEEVDRMNRIESGRIRLERRTFDGRLLILHVSGPGELVAEGSLFADRYHCDATAIEDSVVSQCARKDLLRAMAETPAVGIHFGRLVARQLQTVRLRLELRNVRSAEERILLYLAASADPDSRRLELTCPLQDVAAEIGLTREALYRALSRLEAGGAIRREAGAVTVLRTV